MSDRVKKIFERFSRAAIRASPTEEHEIEFGGFGKVVIEESSTFGFDAIGAAFF